MIFLQGLEKVQVTIQNSIVTAAAGTNCDKMEMYKTITELQLFLFRLYRLSVATKYADWT